MKKHFVLIYLALLCFTPKLWAQKIWTLKDCIAYGRAHNFEAEEQIVLNAIHKEAKKNVEALYLPQAHLISNPTYTAGLESPVWQSGIGLEFQTIIYSGSKKKQELQKADLIIAQSQYTIAMAENNVEMLVLYAYTEALSKKEQYHIQVDFYTRSLQLYDHLKTYKTLTAKDDAFFNALLQQDYQEIQLLNQQYNIALLKIKQLINLQDAPDFEIDEIPSFKPVYTTISEAFSKAMTADPGISSHLLDIDIAKREVKIAQSALFPVVRLQYSPYYSLGTPLNSAGMQNYVGLQISIPVFNRKGQKALGEQAMIQLKYQQTQFDNQKEILFNAVVLLIEELENKQALTEYTYTTLSKTTLLLNESTENIKRNATSCEAYLTIRNWNKQNVLQSIVLKYETIAQAKLLDFYTGIAL